MSVELKYITSIFFVIIALVFVDVFPPLFFGGLVKHEL